MWVILWLAEYWQPEWGGLILDDLLMNQVTKPSLRMHSDTSRYTHQNLLAFLASNTYMTYIVSFKSCLSFYFYLVIFFWQFWSCKLAWHSKKMELEFDARNKEIKNIQILCKEKEYNVLNIQSLFVWNLFA